MGHHRRQHQTEEQPRARVGSGPEGGEHPRADQRSEADHQVSDTPSRRCDRGAPAAAIAGLGIANSLLDAVGRPLA